MEKEVVTLEELRANWEKTWDVVLLVPIKLGSFRKVYSLLKRVQDDKLQYRLHRYFLLVKNWQISVDMPYSREIEPCIAHIQRDKDVKDAYLELLKE